MDEKEYIEREAAIDFVKNHTPTIDGETTIQCVERSLENVPTADVVEVVRCKDCKHWLKDVAGCTDFVGRCEWANYMVGAAGYCVYGEKMDGKGEGDVV